MTTQMIRAIFDRAWKGFGDHQVPRLSAALTFYLMLSLSPMVLLLTVGAGLFYDAHFLQAGLQHEVGHAIGREQGSFIATLFPKGNKESNIIATLFSLLIMMYAASGFFEQLHDSVNLIWGAKSHSGIRSAIIRKLAAMLMVILGAAVFIGWIVLDAWLGYARRSTALPQGLGHMHIWRVVGFVISLGFWSLIFAGAFRLLPHQKLSIKDVVLAAVVTTVLFAVGQFILSLYFSYSSIASANGSAGAIIMILLWVYYSSQIFFVGVEISHAYAYLYGSLRESTPEHELTPSIAGTVT